MGNVISNLSEFVSNQIAAGEVVQKTSSVVKELMENSIDAGSSMIIVNIKDGGKELIQIIDDGCGMSFDDALKSFERHATSKISDVNDLSTLATFGFRGEALPSIASVAEVELKSKQEDAELGVRVEINGGQIVDHSVCALSSGTQVSVRNIFYNYPARRKHLRSNSSELRDIRYEFQKVALSYPRVSFFMYCDDKCIYNMPPSNLRTRVMNVMGKVVNSHLIDIHVDTSIIEMSGYIGKPQGAKKGAEQFMFVNGRYFKKPAFHKAIQNAYQKLLPSDDKMPPYFLYFKIDPEKIDVNVHPQKTEVRFDEEGAIWQIINSAIRECLGKNGIVPMIDFDSSNNIDIPIFDKNSEFKMPEIDVNPDFNPFGMETSYSLGSERKPISSGRTSSLGNINRDDVVDEWGDDDWGTLSDNAGAEITDDSYLNGAIIETENYTEYSESVFSDTNENSREGYIEIDSYIEPVEERFTEFEEGMRIGDTMFQSGRYIVLPVTGNVLFVDAQRAYSRILYERYSNRVDAERQSAGQKLLFPVDIILSRSDFHLVESYAEEMERFGFEFSSNEASSSISITATPADADNNDTEGLFEELLGSLKQDDIAGYTISRSEKLISGMAGICSNRNFSGLSNSEMKQLAEELFSCSNHSYTPSGNQIYTIIKLSDIDKKLK